MKVTAAAAAAAAVETRWLLIITGVAMATVHLPLAKPVAPAPPAHSSTFEKKHDEMKWDEMWSNLIELKAVLMVNGLDLIFKWGDGGITTSSVRAGYVKIGPLGQVMLKLGRLVQVMLGLNKGRLGQVM